MSSSDYMKMIEVPVQSCDVVVKPKRKKQKDVKEEVIQKINEDVNVKEYSSVRRKAFKPRKTVVRKNKVKKIEPIETQTVSVKSSRFDIVSVQVVAVFVLIVGIILTNIFLEDSGMNNLLRSVFGTDTQSVSTLEFSEFQPLSPSKTGEVSLEGGVMSVNGGSVYSPCDGVIERIDTVDGKFNVTVRHSDSFSTLISGLELCYGAVGETVYSNIALGYSEETMLVSMFDGNSLLTEYTIAENEIVWLA